MGLNLQVKTTVEPDNGKGNVEVCLSAGNLEEDGCKGALLWAQLLDGEGTEADRIFPVPLKEEISFCMEAADVRLWNSECPYFYELVLELRDPEGKLLGTTAKKISFLVWEYKDGKAKANGRAVRLRPYVYDRNKQENMPENALEDILAAAKKAHYNAFLETGTEKRTKNLTELCRKYGLYDLKTGDFLQEADGILCAAAEDGTLEFSLEVTRQGILIENHCVFANASAYDLCCSIEKEGRIFAKEILSADVPPQRTRFVEHSMNCPKEAGEYIYRAALCLKRDTPWARKGYAVAEGRAVFANIYIT